ncbi:MAG TPA: histone deacetylase family protein [Mycobacteriales bacterium]|nr:histone deacetylase family protein [Mycobacteriales bacterium]
MTVRVPVVSSDDCLRHDPAAEIWVGVRTPGTEVAERVTVIRAATEAAGATQLAAVRCEDRILKRVHSNELLDYLATAWERWVAAGFPEQSGQDRVVPYVFPTAALLAGLPAREPAAAHARAGRYCYDTMTLIGPGTWEAARAAVDVAATAARLVAAGQPMVLGLCRPPGHHATRDGFGGSCYLNNAAVAAEVLLEVGAERVAVVDIDAHHGNGTQALFYDRADVFYSSLHVDPGAGWFPHYAGFADERGRGAGAGTTLNLPLAPGTEDTGWLRALLEIRSAVEDYSPDAMVLSLGVDAAAGDPESPLGVTRDGFRQAGELLSGLAPCVGVLEGGYDLGAIGDLVCAVLEGMA